jgi:hypothetical protein
MTRSGSRDFGSSDLVVVAAVTSCGSLSYRMTQLTNKLSFDLTRMQYFDHFRAIQTEAAGTSGNLHNHTGPLELSKHALLSQYLQTFYAEVPQGPLCRAEVFVFCTPDITETHCRLRRMFQLTARNTSDWLHPLQPELTQVPHPTYEAANLVQSGLAQHPQALCDCQSFGHRPVCKHLHQKADKLSCSSLPTINHDRDK